MAEKISVQIELAGGAEIARQLEGIGEAGTKAFADIAKAAEGAGGFNQLKPEEVTTKLQQMGVTGAESIKKIQDAVKSAGRLETLVQGITAVETGLAALAIAAVPVGAAIVTAFTAAAKATIAFAGEVNKVNDQAIKLGASVEQVDQFRAGLEQAGVSAKSVGEILQSKLASEQGIEGLQRFIKQLEQMPNSAARSAAAIKEFGSAGAELIQILQAGGQLTGFGPPGGLISEEDAKKATRLAQALNGLESSFNRLSSISLAPTLTVGINAVTVAVQALGQKLEQTPWTTWFNLANLGLNPIASLLSTIAQAFTPLTSEIQKSGQAVQQTGVIFTQWGTVASQAGQQAAQAGTLATVGFTSYGTVVGQATDKTNTFSQSLAGITWDSISSAGVQAWNAIVSAVGGAARAIANFVSSLTGITWDSISNAGVQAWNAIVSAVEGAARAIANFVSSLTGITWDAISSAGVQAWNALTGAIGDATTAVGNFFRSLASGAWDKVQQLLGIGGGGAAPAAATRQASGGLLGGRGTGTSDSNLAWVSRGEYIMPASAVRQPGVLAFLEALRRSGRIPGFADGGAVGGGGGDGAGGGVIGSILNATQQNTQAIKTVDQNVSSIGQQITGLESYIGRTNDECAQHAADLAAKLDSQKEGYDIFWEALFNVVQTVEDQLGRVEDRLPAGAREGYAGGYGWPFALGGMVGGRGTGTSDSNLARVSRGEYITPARAVSQPGVLAFLEALRRSGGNLAGVLDGMGRFALGGMVPRAIPAFATGGLAGGMSNVTIQFPGLPDISGLRASSGVVEELRKSAALAQVRSGGRKPSRYS